MFFIESAHAQAASSAGEPNIVFQMVLMLGLFALMYFMIIRPQRKRQKQHTDLLTQLGKGDEVLLSSGMLGKIVLLNDDYVVLDVAANLELKFQKAAVQAVLPKGTIKSI
ncbi:MAG TPA: preprotein translocase subunit YajC [Porticoccaceae bacterium]|nr:preprotein translocase subunit YajC [Porticoccaceae bacterium]|tara:strand:- start:492 stop:821 length:330 start_codon:yes stop_codon:yes gene_type:complete